MHQLAALGMLAALVFAPGASRAEPIAPSPTAVQLEWTHLGPPKPDSLEIRLLTALAVSPDWPREGTILAVGADGVPGPALNQFARATYGERFLLRSRDGGAAWETLPYAIPPSGPIDPRWVNVRNPLTLARSNREGLVAFAWEGPDLYRSTDVGESWRHVLNAPALVFPRVRDPSRSLAPRLLFSPSFAEDHLVFVIDERAVYRSANAGSEWQTVLALQDPQPLFDRTPSMALSPNFARDRLAIVTSGGGLYRTEDGGATWDRVLAPSDQHVQQAIFSPTFVADRTIFAAVVSDGFLVFGDPPRRELPLSAHQNSLGVLVSRDTGQTWADASLGLEIDGTPYRHVQSLFASPTYSADSTLFALVWGAIDASTPRETWNGALFRSGDGARSWEPVLPMSQVWGPALSWVGFSPDFATDGVAVLAHRYPEAGIRRGTFCSVQRTGDWGATWAQVWRPRSYSYLSGSGDCGRVPLFGANPGELASVQSNDGGSSFYVLETTGGFGALWSSHDAGASWARFDPPDGKGAARAILPPSGLYPLATAADGTVFVATDIGIWALTPTR